MQPTRMGTSFSTSSRTLHTPIARILQQWMPSTPIRLASLLMALHQPALLMLALSHHAVFVAQKLASVKVKAVRTKRSHGA